MLGELVEIRLVEMDWQEKKTNNQPPRHSFVVTPLLQKEGRISTLQCYLGNSNHNTFPTR